MNPSPTKAAQAAAVTAARAAGDLIRRNWRSAKRVNSSTRHDIKLELDLRCQRTIERLLRRACPDFGLFGEEGATGDPEAPARWVVDPIDGTVNFAYGIPHACVSIALQVRRPASPRWTGRARGAGPSPFQTVVGVVYDPFCDELWTAARGGPARLNGRPIHASKRARLGEAIVSIGFAKNRRTLNLMLPVFNSLVHRVRKIRIMGAAALALTYVASGRFDAYVESGLRLWDIAAGGLILESAGGEFWYRELAKDDRYEIIANNGRLRRSLRRCWG